MITKKFIKWLVIKMRSKSTNHSPITINAERTRSKRRDLNLGPYSLLRGEKSQTYHSDFHHWLSIIKVISLLHSSLHCQFCFLALTDLLINSNFWQRAPQKSIYISAWENNAIKKTTNHAKPKVFPDFSDLRSRNLEFPWPDEKFPGAEVKLFLLFFFLIERGNLAVIKHRETND